MYRLKILISLTIFSLLLFGTSIIKNQTRDLEKKILNLSEVIHYKEKDLNESQLDFYYLSSPAIVEQKIENLDNEKYQPMAYSNIFLSMSNFFDLQNKLVKKKDNEK